VIRAAADPALYDVYIGWSSDVISVPAGFRRHQVNSALHPSRVAKPSTSFGWGKGGNFTSVGLQVTLCDPIRHVSSCSGVATLRTAIHLLLTYLLKTLINVFTAIPLKYALLASW